MRITSNMLYNKADSMYASMLYGRYNALSNSVSSRTAAKKAAIQKNGYLNLPDSFYQTNNNAQAGIAGRSEALRSSALNLSSGGKNGIYASARNNKSNGNLLLETRQMVSGYNATIKNLRNKPSTINTYYQRSLENAVTQNKEALEKVGITVNRDNSLSIREQTFRSADVDDIENALGGANGMTRQLANISDSVSQSASREVLSNFAYNRYGSYGSFESYLSALLGGGFNSRF